MPNRHGPGNSDYRYGFNGMEKDDEMHGQDGSSYTTYFRQNDVRIGRWLSIDPIRQEYMSPYNSMDNNPIFLIDPLGSKTGDYYGKDGKWLANDGKDDGKVYGESESGNGLPNKYETIFLSHLFNYSF